MLFSSYVLLSFNIFNRMNSSQPVTLVSDTIKIKRKRTMTVRGKLLEDAKRMAKAAEKKP